ncbi:hypothetical protein [Rhizobium sp. WYCCWR 11128]|uniref:type II toxin-antitoxin system RelE/ParE family toxin n=1 Tax=Rhizobium sp. WYCCWR 11128 TaxID=2749832 RepID=UPI0032B225EC
MDYYAREAGAQVAISFVDALQSTFGLIARHPASGSLRYECRTSATTPWRPPLPFGLLRCCHTAWLVRTVRRRSCYLHVRRSS